MRIKKLGVIGCGNMGNAIIEGIVTNKDITVDSIYVFDKINRKTNRASRRRSIRKQSSSIEVAKKSHIIIIAVKPQDSGNLLKEIGPYITRAKLIITIMAGIKMAKISQFVDRGVPIARVMPNMAAFVKEAISGISYNRFVTSRQKRIVRELFKGIGRLYETQETMQDAVTALTGSGPAYFFYLVESFVNVAVRLGFSRKEALKFITQTMKGSARLLEESGISPEELRKKVTSKGGTTEAAVRILEKSGVRKSIAGAVSAAIKRSRELSK